LNVNGPFLPSPARASSIAPAAAAPTAMPPVLAGPGAIAASESA
jgi:hypothetical protein